MHNHGYEPQSKRWTRFAASCWVFIPLVRDSFDQQISVHCVSETWVSLTFQFRFAFVIGASRIKK